MLAYAWRVSSEKARIAWKGTRLSEGQLSENQTLQCNVVTRVHLHLAESYPAKCVSIYGPDDLGRGISIARKPCWSFGSKQ